MDVGAYWILLPQMGISIVSWGQLLLSMNRYRGACSFTRNDLWALLLFVHGGFVRWIAALSLRTSSVTFQLTAAFLGAAIGWASFVIVFNEDFTLPTRQQTWALLLSLVITGLWEANNRLLFELPAS